MQMLICWFALKSADLDQHCCLRIFAGLAGQGLSFMVSVLFMICYTFIWLLGFL